MPDRQIVKALSVSKGSVYINRCMVESETAYHSHNFIEIAYVAGGSGLHNVDGTEFAVSRGHITLINYDVPHKFTAKEGGLLIYNCIFTPGYLETGLDKSRNFFDVNGHFLLGNFFGDENKKYIDAAASGNGNAQILNLFEKMHEEYEKKEIGYREIMRGYLIELLVMICRLQRVPRTDREQGMQAVLDYINGHYTQEIRLEELAELSNRSVAVFCRRFKAYTGTTVNQYLQYLRIEEACRLLGTTDKSVIEIAGDVGYHDMKHFYRLFKKITNRLPKDFR